MDFTKIIRNNIKPNQIIDNWSADNRNLKVPKYEFISCNGDKVTLKNPATCKQYTVTEKDFQYLWENWRNYKSGKIKRNELRNGNRKTSYAICIMHYLEEKKFL